METLTANKVKTKWTDVNRAILWGRGDPEALRREARITSAVYQVQKFCGSDPELRAEVARRIVGEES